MLWVLVVVGPLIGIGLHDALQNPPRVERYHAGTVAGFLDLLAAMGLHHPRELGPGHVFRRISDTKVRRFSEIYEFIGVGQMLEDGSVPKGWRGEWEAANPDRW